MDQMQKYLQSITYSNMKRSIGILLIASVFISYGCSSDNSGNSRQAEEAPQGPALTIEQDKNAETISIFRNGLEEPLVVQNAKADFRPYLHPIKAPDGNGVLTEYSPGHHTHQTGLYWGFTQVNGRDYFHNPGGDYWERVSANVVDAEGDTVRWQTVYNLLDAQGQAVLTETRHWSLTQQDGKVLLDLEWTGEAQKDVTIGEYDYGGLFLRMPWQEGIEGEAINADGQENQQAEGQRSIWVDVGMEIDGRQDPGRIAIFGHPANAGAPLPWRVDGQLGVGPVRARLGDWQIREGNTETIRHRVVVYTGQHNGTELTNMWEQYTDTEAQYAQTQLWEQAQKEGMEAKFLPPDAAADSMTFHNDNDYKVNVWASEPMMRQPMATAWDTQGRLWVAENLDYESRSEGFSNDGNSRIVILEDTNGDGKADKRKIFMEGIAFPSAIAVGFDGVFVGAPPNLLFIPDKNNDDKADVEDIEVRLTGWGIRDRHEVMNSLNWGPDGWLYGLQGFATPSNIRKPEGDGRLYHHNDPFPKDILEGEGTQINGGVWRYHPIKDKFEVVAHGFSNPWGMDFDAKGQLLMSACVIPHLWHVIPGGIYHRQGGQHFNPYVYEDIKTIVDHRHRSAHGGARVYLSDAFPRNQYGRIFMANIHEHAVLSDELTRKGSGYVASHGEDFMNANNAQFVGFSMERGPGGNLYVVDWHDASICGDAVHNKDTGRIFRIAPVNSQAENWEGRYSDLSTLSDQKLVAMQTKQSAWHSRKARVILQNRAAKGELAQQTHRQLRDIYQNNNNPDWRLRGMWGLHVTGGLDENDLMKALEDRNEYIRGWAIQLLGEDRSVSPKAREKFVQMARQDSSPVVRLYLASVLQRIDHKFRWDIVEQLIQHTEDADDHNLPKMIWLGLEPLIEDNPQRAMKLVAKSEIPLVTKFVARRGVDAEAIKEVIAGVERNSSEAQVQLNLLRGMQDGLEGQYDINAPGNWEQVYNELQESSDDQIRSIALRLSQQFGDIVAVQKTLNLIQNTNVELEKRREALATLAAQQNEKLVTIFPDLLSDKSALWEDAIQAVAAYNMEQLGALQVGYDEYSDFVLIERYASFNEAEQSAVIQAMASRPIYGWLLTQALQNDVISKDDISPHIARQLKRVVGSGFMEVWAQPIAQDDETVKNRYAKYEKLLTENAISKASVANGRVVFEKTCASCHTLYDAGTEIGPDLTGLNRTSVDYLLFNIIQPSVGVANDYKLVVVNMRDGRTYSGLVVGENDQSITMRIVGQDPIIINKSEIQSREQTDVSMMPTGLFNQLSDNEVLDLMRYLRTKQQVPLKK